jgi:hypothetical protein
MPKSKNGPERRRTGIEVKIFEELKTLAETTDQLPEFLGQLETVRMRARQRLLAPAPAAPAPEERIGVTEAARRLGVSVDLLYKHPPKYRRLECRDSHSLLYSAAAIERYIKHLGE